MVKRFGMNKKNRIWQNGSFGELTTIYRAAVAPNSTLSLEASTILNSETISGLLTVPMRVEIAYYYVPFRLLWDEFADLVVAHEGDTEPTWPTTNVDFPEVMDWDASKTVTGTHSAMARRAYKAVYNAYYGESQIDEHYNNITSDVTVQALFVRSGGQLYPRITLDAELSDEEIDVSGGSLSMRDFQRSWNDYRAKRGLQLSGDDYVDAMRALGVSLDWRLQMVPERLGTVGRVFNPIDERDPGGTDAGKTRGRYYGTLKSGFASKRFAEHGLVIGVMYMRPYVPNTQIGHPEDGMLTGRHRLWMGQQDGELARVDEAYFSSSASGDKAAVPRFWEYRLGLDYGTGGYGINTNPADLEQAMYPRTFAFTSLDQVPQDYVTMTYAELSGKTPVPPLRQSDLQDA